MTDGLDLSLRKLFGLLDDRWIRPIVKETFRAARRPMDWAYRAYREYKYGTESTYLHVFGF